jgi:MFS family permease
VASGTPGGTRTWLTISLVGLVTAAAFEGMSIPTVMPRMVADLGDLDLYGWAFSSFWLTNIVGITLAGTDADRRGPARAFAISIALFAIGLLVAGMAPTMPIVILGRAIQGFGSGGLASIVYVVIARAYPPHGQARMIAALSSAWVVPGLVGPALAGVVADSVGWRWVFLGIVIPIVVLGLAPLVQIRPLAPPANRPPTPGMRSAGRAVLLAAGSTIALAGLTPPVPILLPLMVGGGLTLALIGLRPLVPAGTLRVARGRPAVVATVFVFTFAFLGVEAFVPLAVSTIRGAGTVAGGLALSAAAVTWATGSWIAARLARAPGTPRRPQVVGGLLFIAAGTIIVAVVLLPGAPIATAVVGWGVAGLGMGVGYSTLSLLVLETATVGEEGASSAALQLMFTLGTAFGAGIGGAIVALADAAVLDLVAAVAIVDGLMVAVALAGVAMAWRIPARSVRAAAPTGRVSGIPTPPGHVASPAERR